MVDMFIKNVGKIISLANVPLLIAVFATDWHICNLRSMYTVTVFIRDINLALFGQNINDRSGGWWDGSTSNSAAKYDGSWSSVGPMVKERRGHRSVVHENVIYHIGGGLFTTK